MRGGGRDILLVRDLVYSVDGDGRLLDSHRGRPARVLGRVLVDNLGDDRARPFRRLDSRVLSSERGQSGGPHRRRVVRFGALGIPLLVQELVENVVQTDVLFHVVVVEGVALSDIGAALHLLILSSLGHQLLVLPLTLIL